MENTKYRYIDLNSKEGREGFKDMYHLKKGDEVEVNIFELGYPEISDFIYALKRTADRMNTTIELSFNQGTTFDGFQTFRFNNQTTQLREDNKRLRDQLQSLLNSEIELVDGYYYLAVSVGKMIKTKRLLNEAEQLLEETDQ